MVDHGGLMHGVTLSPLLQHRFSVVTAVLPTP